MTDTLRLTTADGMDISLEVAGVGSRSYAFIVDWHIRVLLVLVWLGAMLLAFDPYKLEGLLGRLDLVASWKIYFILAPPLLAYFLYHPALEILMRGRTPGKRLAGVRIVTTDGRTPGIGALLVRNLLRIVDCLPSFYLVGLLVAMTTARHVRIGDLAAGTMLVHETGVSSKSLQTATRLALSRSLSPADQALLLDLLERWSSLRRQARIDLGSRFLVKIGAAMPEAQTPAAMDQALFEQLSAFADGAPGRR
jgi:uncharacterized RDD family membrane protein YckC